MLTSQSSEEHILINIKLMYLYCVKEFEIADLMRTFIFCDKNVNKLESVINSTEIVHFSSSY